MPENAKMQCLSNNLVRRMLNTKEDLPPSFKSEVIDMYARKLLTSDYDTPQTRRVLIAGIKGYYAKVRRSRQSGRRIHYTAEESRKTRTRKKLLGKTSWYKRRRGVNDKEAARRGVKPGVEGDRKSGKKDLKVRAVLFIEQTPFEELARRAREILSRLEGTMGYRVKVVERVGKAEVWPTSSCGQTCGGDWYVGEEAASPATRVWRNCRILPGQMWSMRTFAANASPVQSIRGT